ncbi:hypothetical protein J4G48_0036450 [Bradyrhizobium barranii subsp. apii]|uniref:hypothetical protein n=1 Tax=Bradyrhizobium barranii TaxID=2992140 RepID=UPI001CD42068|nr:hypothetical protein [Bradyrhizobium barranii]UPT94716.1 hypothetical protein J4G48_0036450 [Bradyrhizobium barranii subsp. apii]
MIMLQATHDIRKVALWLGHADIRTTEVYLRMDPSERLEAVEAVVPPEQHDRAGHISKLSLLPFDLGTGEGRSCCA